MRLILPESNAQRKTRPRSSNRGVRSCGRMVVSVKTAAALSIQMARIALKQGRMSGIISLESVCSNGE